MEHEALLRKMVGPDIRKSARAAGYIYVTKVSIMVTVLMIVAAAIGGFLVGAKVGAKELAVVQAELASLKSAAAAVKKAI